MFSTIRRRRKRYRRCGGRARRWKSPMAVSISPRTNLHTATVRYSSSTAARLPAHNEDKTVFDFSPRVADYKLRLEDFMAEHIYPCEDLYYQQSEKLGPWRVQPIVEELKDRARAAGLWNLWVPDPNLGAGLSNLDYAPLCEIMGRSNLAPEVFNCSAPDTGNMETIWRYGTPEHHETWLKPLLAGEMRSAFAMTEPEVASSDATNIRSDRHRQQSMILVPRDTPGVRVVRPLPVFGTYGVPDRAAEVTFDDVRVSASNVLLGEGRGFEIAQGRLGPGRMHHCMRLIGLAERVLERMCRRAESRSAFDRTLAEQGVTLERIAQARVMIEQARLLTFMAAHMM